MLFLALMPGGDHLNIIDPPGLTVMRIAGGRYRVTAAHRVVWTWMNEFASIAEESSPRNDPPENPSSPPLQVGDLVSLTIVDVFETDNQGKLLSYCPTFDNRDVQKTNQAAETVRKTSSQFFSMLGRAQKAVANTEVNRKATEQFSKLGIMQQAQNIGKGLKSKVDEAVQQYNSPNKKASNNVTGLEEFEQAMTAAEAAATGSLPPKDGEGDRYEV